MKCPACQASHISTVTTRQWDDASVVRQRRCVICRSTWMTHEEIKEGRVSFKTWPPTIELDS